MSIFERVKMAWNKQIFKKKEDQRPVEKIIRQNNPNEISSRPVDMDKFYVKKFHEDFAQYNNPHAAQKAIQDAFFSGEYSYIFQQCGRKFAKTTSLIRVAWWVCNTYPGTVCYMCYPTITQGIEVVWEERRLQNFDLKDEVMFERYVKKTDDNKHILTFNNGSYIKLIGTWTEARGRGTQPDLLLVDEVQDCSPAYLEAMDSNLAAKPNSKCIMSGTPSPKPSHYQEWRERIRSMPKGKVFHYSSYDNTALPHLKDWLDAKRTELIKAGKKDVWDREYMAIDNFSSADRVLPDPNFEEKDVLMPKLRQFAYSERIPILAVSVHQKYFCAILAVLNAKQNIFIIDVLLIPQLWSRSFSEIFPLLGPKLKEVQDLCGKKLRSIVWDDSKSFTDVISGFTTCRKDLKWQDRGIPLLREMLQGNKISFSQDLGDFGLECQNMLVDESMNDIEKKYPYTCTLSMMVNEYFQREKVSISKLQEFDKFQPLRDMGIICPPAKSNKKRIFGFNLT